MALLVFALILPAAFAANLVSDFKQCANNDSPYTLGECHWIGSIIQQSNSQYFEGMSVAQRLVFTNISSTTGNIHTLTLSHQAMKSSIHAYDFITSYNQSNNPAITLNACGEEIGPPGTLGATCTSLRSGSNYILVDVPDAMGSVGGDDVASRVAAYETAFGNRQIKIYGNSPITSASLSFDGYDTDANDATQVHAFYTLTWTSSSTQVLIEMAGHLSISGDGTGISYGPGKGSSSISGGPYHFSLHRLDGDSLGKQDNQIKGADIQVPPQGTLTVIKTVITDNGGTAVSSSFNVHVKTGGVDVAGSPAAGSSTGTAYTLDPATYVVSEDSLAGYLQTSIVCDNQATDTVTIANGDNKVCTITNNDVAPTLTLIKTVTNDNGGTKAVADFPLFIGTTQVTSGVANVLNAGSYTASETNQAGYAAGVWGGDCASNGTVTLAVGDNKTCTITNDDVAPKLHLRKVVVNDNGGTAVDTAWTLTANGVGSNDVSGSTPVDSGAGLIADNFSLSESGPAGYASSDWVCFGGTQVGSNITIGIGQEATCTITNDDIQPKLTLVKTVVNNYGGQLVVADFPLFISGTPATSGTKYGLNADSYTASETNQTGYSAGSWGGDCAADGSITLAVGDDKTCTITNSDIEPKLKLVKKVINDNGGTLGVGDFDLFVGQTNVDSNVFNGFNAGSYVASEVQQYGYAASDWSGDCASDGSITLSVGDEKTCYITNNDIAPKLTLIKYVTNDNGGTLEVKDFPLFISGNPAVSGQTYDLNAGTQTASETQQYGYSSTGWAGDCATNGTITQSVGDVNTCTITNDDIQPTITLVKLVNNNFGGTKQVADFPLFVDQTSVTSGVPLGIDTGSYTASETESYGYTASDWNGDCSSNGSVTVSVGDNKVCYIQNSDIQPKLTVIKHVINDNGGNNIASDFTINVDGTSASPSSFAGSEDGNLVLLNAGDYSADEEAFSGYAKNLSGNCSGTISIGDEKTCTITNDDIAPTITLVKVVNNTFNGQAVPSDFDLNIDDSIVLQNTAIEVTANSAHSIGESNLYGYEFVSITGDAKCPAVLGGSVTLDEGESITCTITNQDIQPKLTLVKTVINDNGGTLEAGDFALYVSGNPVTSGVANGFDAGSYTATEDNVSSYEASSWTGDCAADGSVTLSVGDEKTCYITNNDKRPQLIVIKHVINDNGGTKAASDFSISVDANSPSPSSFAGEESPGTIVDLNAGTYNVDEGTVFGYEKTLSSDCSETISVGETKTCTITNNDISPQLIVIKHVINDNGGTLQAPDFTITVIGTNVSQSSFAGAESPGTAITLNAGSYNVNEPNTLDYGKTLSADCSGTIDLNQTKTCTITNDDIPATRTLGFWQTHTIFTTWIFQNKLGSALLIGSSPHRGTLTTTAQIFGGFYASIPYKSTGAKRQNVDKTRIQLLQQLLAAKLNCAAFTCTSSAQSLISQADAAFASGNISQMNSLASQLDAYNNSGDSISFPAGLPAQGSATPDASKAIANFAYWDAP
ncbi:MAG: hypothetical protein V1847_03635 [Candidatus Diapherotrites archaeon]